MSISAKPFLVANSVFLRLAQRRYNLSREALAVVAMELQKGTSLRVITMMTGIRYAVIKSLTTLPWQTAPVSFEPTAAAAEINAREESLSVADKASIRDLFRLKVKTTDIAVYMRLPLALVRAYLK